MLRTAAGLKAGGAGEDERFVGLLHLGAVRHPAQPKERAPVQSFATYLA